MKLRKKLLGYLTVIWLWFAAFAPSAMVGNTVYAVDEKTENTTTTSVEEWRQEIWDFIDLWLKLIYVVLRPMLFLAGIAMDNSMVYWSVFHMDAPLWTFWNMTKNFANFMLGFIVLFSILKWIFSSFWKDKGNDARSPMTVIKNTLIAGVLIQASWFLTAALIDISTVATYSIWGMPTALLKNDNTEKIRAKRFLPSHSQLDLNNIDTIWGKELMVRSKIPLSKKLSEKEETINVSPCLVKQLWTSSYVVGRAFGSTTWVNFNHTNTWYITAPVKKFRNICVFWDKVYFFNEFPNVISSWENNYSSNLMKNINDLWGIANEVAKCWFFIDLRSENKAEDCKESVQTAIETHLAKNKSGQQINDIFLTKNTLFQSDAVQWVGRDKAEGYGSRIEQTTAPTVGKIIDKSKWFMGPLVTIYVSIMDFANLGDTSIQNSSFGKNLWDLLIRVGVALGMVFPLIALAVVLFIRIWYLWVVIAASPILILANVFKDTLKMDKMLETFSMENILKAMFAPVITVFALSISVVFMTTLSGSVSTNNMNQINVISNFGWKYEKWPDKSFNYITFFWYTVAYPKQVSTYAWATWDRFSWMIVSFCGIGIMRFILFAAIKASWAIGKVWDTIKSFWENVFKTAPIVPIAGWVGLGTLKEQIIDNNFAEKYRNTQVVDFEWQKRRMDDYVGERFWWLEWNTSFNNQYISKNTDAFLEKSDYSGTIKYLNEKGVIKGENIQDQQKSMMELYTSNAEFRKMIEKHEGKENLSQGLFWNENFISEKKDEEQKTLKENLGNEISKTTYENKAKLDEAITKISKDKFKNLPDWEIKTITTSDNRKYKIIKKWEELKSEELTTS